MKSNQRSNSNGALSSAGTLGTLVAAVEMQYSIELKNSVLGLGGTGGDLGVGVRVGERERDQRVNGAVRVHALLCCAAV